MRIATGAAWALGLALSPATTRALLVAPDSPCSVHCGNVLSSTSGSDITCDENSFGSGSGAVFKSCTTCELTSEYKSGRQTDLQWLLYNVRYAFSYCLFGFPNNDVGSNPCLTSRACAPLKNSVTYASLSRNVSAYNYCSVWDESDVENCAACLVAGEHHFLNNYLTILDAGCQQQPDAGSTLSVEGDPFTTVPMNITTPHAGEFVDLSNDGFPLGAKVGIAIGAVLFILFLGGCFIVCNGKRRRRAFLRRLETRQAGPSAWAQMRHNGGDMFETPVSQRPLRGWEESPVSAQTEKTFPPRYFSPYSSQYNSPVSAVEGPSMQSMPWPSQQQQQQQQQQQDIGVALGGDDSSNHSSAEHRKGKERDESYEMQHVVSPYGSDYAMPPEPQAPVLHHPGYGRGQPAEGYHPWAHSSLTEDDARKGNAL